MQTVNESGLYSLILRSRKPEAKAVRSHCKHPETHKQNESFGLGIPPRGLTNMRKACGAKYNERPNDFLRSVKTQELIRVLGTKERLKVGKFPTLARIEKGRYGGTFAHPYANPRTRNLRRPRHQGE